MKSETVGSHEGDEGECLPDPASGTSGGGGTGRNRASGRRSRSGDADGATSRARH